MAIERMSASIASSRRPSRYNNSAFLLNHETGRKIDEGVSHINMRNGSVASFTISKRGNRSFAMGVAVCLRESVDGESQRLVSAIQSPYLNICSTLLALVSQPPRKSRPNMRSSSERSEDEIIQYHVLAVDTQEQSFDATTFVEPIDCAFELAMFKALLGGGQEVPFAHLEFEFA